MALAYTTQPTADGKYSAYLPIKFIATETANPSFLYFKIRKSDGTAIDEIPFYKAYNISNEFHFDASAYLKAIFDVRSSQGLSTTAIEELTDVYGSYEVVVNTTAVLTAGLISNHFYAFAMLEDRKYLNEETANFGVESKQLLLSNDFNSNDLMPSKLYTENYSGVSLFVEHRYLFISTYGNIEKPNDASTIVQTLYIDLVSYIDKLISIPLQGTFIANNFFDATTGAVPGAVKSFKLTLGGGVTSTSYIYVQPQRVYYNRNINNCDLLEFVYINKYGVKENITFNAPQSEQLKTKSDKYLASGYNSESNVTTFNTSADRQKINQQNTITKTVKGTKMLIKRIDEVKDFLTSPIVWLVGSELNSVIITDGGYKLTKENKGLEVSFKYSNSQTKLSFL